MKDVDTHLWVNDSSTHTTKVTCLECRKRFYGLVARAILNREDIKIGVCDRSDPAGKRSSN